jgi:hypothetical protein
MQRVAVAGPGGAGKTTFATALAADVRLARADTAIILAPPAWRCVWSAVWRSVRDRGRAVQAPGCPERILIFDPEFLRWIRRFRRDRQSLDAAIARHAAHLTVVELHSRAEFARYLDGVAAGTGPHGQSRGASP